MRNEPQRDQTKLMLCQTFTSNFSYSLFWSLDNRALMRWKQAEGFSLLHCSAYVTSGLKSSNPTNAQKCKSKNIICFILKMHCQRATMSLLLHLVLWVLFCNVFSHTKTKYCCARKDPLVQHACPLEAYPFMTNVSLLCTSIPCFPFWNICFKLIFMPFASMVLFSKWFHTLPITS